MDLDLDVKLGVYERFATTGRRPSASDLAERLGVDTDAVLDAWRRLRESRLLVLEPDGAAIRMAPPFSGVETQHRVQAGGVTYFAPCAWDSLGIPAALHSAAIVESRCAESDAPLRLEVGVDGPPPSDWLFHCLVPAREWWADIVHT
jgi:hypothetical protein